MMRGALWRVGVACGMVVAAACSIDEAGSAGDASVVDVVVTDDGAPINDGSPIDGGVPDVQNDVALPPTCTTLDVSCLGLDASPDGWSPFVVVTSGACPSGDYSGTPWQTNPRLANGACACDCTTSGAYTCPQQITIATGGACTMPASVDAGACSPETPQSQHMDLPNVETASGNGVACTPDASTAATATDAVTLCSVGCDAGAQGLCGQPPGSRCIATDGIEPCPNGLTQHIVGSGAIGICDACGCKIGLAPSCTANAEVYFGYDQGGYQPNTNCQTAGQFTAQMLTLNQVCQQATYNFDSFIMTWSQLAAPTCTASDGGGDASLASPKTVCCN